MKVKTTEHVAIAEIARWRRAQLTGSGFPAPLAAQIADDNRFDLHALIELVECGCRPELAVRIQAPLEKEYA